MPRINPYLSIALALTAAAWAASALIYPRLPATVPTHWNIHGQVDGYGSRALALIPVPLVMMGMIAFFLALPAIAPKESQPESFRPTLLFVMAVVVGNFAYLHGVILLVTWQHVTKSPHPLDIGRAMFTGMFLFLALTGSVLGKVRRNGLIGVRVPWTLSSDRVWNDTHRLAAWTLVVGSLVGFVTAAAGFSLVFSFAVLIVSAVIPVVYSFVHYKQLERRGAL